MFTGIPYVGLADNFVESAEWGCILVTREERHRFVSAFNDISIRSEDLKEVAHYLDKVVPNDPRPGSLRRSYVDLVTAMEYARREIQRTPYANQERRDYRQGHETTWLQYVSFSFEPVIPTELDEFLADAVNRVTIIAQYLASPDQWAVAVKIELPMTGSLAYLLTGDQRAWLENQRSALIERLQDSDPHMGFEEVSAWLNGLTESPLPIKLVCQMGQLVRADRADAQQLRLQPHTARSMDQAA